VTQHLPASVEKNQTAKTWTCKKKNTPVEANKFSDAAIPRPALGQIGNTVRLIPPTEKIRQKKKLNRMVIDPAEVNKLLSHSEAPRPQ
jgi:hypothetical protein